MHAVVDRAITAFDCDMFFADAGIDRHLAGRYCWSPNCNHVVRWCAAGRCSSQIMLFFSHYEHGAL